MQVSHKKMFENKSSFVRDHNLKLVYGTPEPDFISKVESFGDLILQRLSIYSDSVGLIEAKTGKSWKHSEIKNQSIELAECLTAAGIKPGDVVGLCSENRKEFPIPLVSTLLIGCTIAPINHNYSEREINHAISLSKPTIIFASQARLQILRKVQKNNSFLKKIIVFDENYRLSDSESTYSEFINRFRKPVQTNFISAKVPLKDQLAFILCSSGTTGMPKGVKLTYNNALTCVSLLSNTYKTAPVNEFIVLTVLPWFHAYGCLSFLSCICSGGTLIFLPRFEEVSFLESIQKYKPSVLFLVPPLMVFLAKNSSVDKYDTSSISLIYCGAAPLSNELRTSVKKRTGIKLILDGYGLTEGTLSVLKQSKDFCKPGSVGILVPGYCAKVVNPDTGITCGPHERGELWVRGSQVMKGYVNDPEATKTTIDEDGFLHTGDIVYYDEDEEFFVVDRLKELIKYKAFQVPPAELEDILLSHPKIKDVAVVGLPDEDAGELPLAFVVKQEGVIVTDAEIIKYIEERVSSSKWIRGGVRFVDSIPKNPSGKIMRRKLKELLVNHKSKL